MLELLKLIIEVVDSRTLNLNDITTDCAPETLDGSSS